MLYKALSTPLILEREQTMGRRHFDDYEPDDWKEEHKRAERERRKRDAKRHRHDSEEKSESRDGRDSRPY